MLNRNKAFICGINAYPGAPLAGCLNDVSDMATFLNTKCGFSSSNIRLLTDRRATTDGILTRLAWLVGGAAPGDKLFFMFSGHGAQVATRDSITEEVDGLDEVICPYNFDWSDRHMIRDNDFAQIFSKIPAGVQFIWVSDSCHSGDLEKDMPAPMSAAKRNKGYPTPVDMAWRSKVAVELGHAPKKTIPNLALISGCKSNQTSADARFSGRANGALTYYLLKALSSTTGLSQSLTTIITMVQNDLKKNGYSQVPQLEGNPALCQGTFFGK